MKGPRLRPPGGGVLERPGRDAGGRRTSGPGYAAGEAVAAGIMKAEGAIMGLFQETGLQDPQGVVPAEPLTTHVVVAILQWGTGKLQP